MDTEDFRAAATAEIDAWRLARHPDVPMFVENGPTADEATVGLIWLDLEIRWYSAKLASVGGRPLGRHTGTIVTNVYFREGEGAARPGRVIDGLKELLRARHLGAAFLGMPARSMPTEVDGWYKAGLLTPFTLDDA